MDFYGGKEMKLLHFFAKFFFFLTILIIVWIPFSIKYLFSPINVLNIASFFIFYLPLNLIPFYALTLATPIEKSKIKKMIIIGSLIIFVFNILIIGLQYMFTMYINEFFLIFAIGRVAIPIIVWLGFVYPIFKGL
jgi:hypothetical protein